MPAELLWWCLESRSAADTGNIRLVGAAYCPNARVKQVRKGSALVLAAYLVLSLTTQAFSSIQGVTHSNVLSVEGTKLPAIAYYPLGLEMGPLPGQST